MLEWLFGKKKQQPKKEQKRKQKQKQKNLTKQSQDKWMYEFMVQFLTSPIWRVTILDFVDNKCIVFDNEEENKFEYTLIHNEFKQVVGNLVDGMMQEIGLSEDKLAELIEKGFRSKEIKLFNQLLLVDDFLRFKDLMVKRNRSLQQQAIKALQQSHVKSNQVNHVNQTQSRRTSKIQQERQLLRESKRLEDERKRKLEEEQEQMLRKAIQLSKISSQQNQALKQLQQKAFDQEHKQPEIKKVQQQPKKQQIKQESKVKSTKLQPLKGTINNNNKVPSQLNQLPPLNVKAKKVSLPKQQQNISSTVFEKEELKPQIIPQQQQQPVITQIKQKQESLEQRKQRLLAQRQKIRKQKQEQRKKQLESEQPQKSTNIHHAVLQEDGIHDTNIGLKQSKVQVVQENKVSEEEIKRRKELMNKIKNRIIDDF